MGDKAIPFKGRGVECWDRPGCRELGRSGSSAARLSTKYLDMISCRLTPGYLAPGLTPHQLALHDIISNHQYLSIILYFSSPHHPVIPRPPASLALLNTPSRSLLTVHATMSPCHRPTTA